jgi:hypothetical protein
MDLFSPKDECLLTGTPISVISVPQPFKSGDPSGPNTAATIVLGITFLIVCADVFMLASHAMGSDLSTTKRITVVFAILIQIVAFYSYERHYQTCQSWKGWFICMIGSLVVSNLLRRFVTDPDEDTTNIGSTDGPPIADHSTLNTDPSIVTSSAY